MALKKKYIPKSSKPTRFWGAYDSSKHKWIAFDRRRGNAEVRIVDDREHLIRIVKYLNLLFENDDFVGPRSIKQIELTANAVL